MGVYVPGGKGLVSVAKARRVNRKYGLNEMLLMMFRSANRENFKYRQNIDKAFDSIIDRYHYQDEVTADTIEKVLKENHIEPLTERIKREYKEIKEIESSYDCGRSSVAPQ